MPASDAAAKQRTQDQANRNGTAGWQGPCRTRYSSSGYSECQSSVRTSLLAESFDLEDSRSYPIRTMLSSTFTVEETKFLGRQKFAYSQYLA